MPEHLDQRSGPGQWVTIKEPARGTLWTNGHIIGFQAVPGEDTSGIDALVDEANKLITIPIDQRFTTLIDTLTGLADRPEDARRIQRTIKHGDLKTWSAR